MKFNAEYECGRDVRACEHHAPRDPPVASRARRALIVIHSLSSESFVVRTSEVDGPSTEQLLYARVWQRGWEGTGYVRIRDYS